MHSFSVSFQGTLVFEHGESIKTIQLEIIDDHSFEKDETFTLELTELKTDGAKFGRLKRTVVTIVSDDGTEINYLFSYFYFFSWVHSFYKNLVSKNDDTGILSSK